MLRIVDQRLRQFVKRQVEVPLGFRQKVLQGIEAEQVAAEISPGVSPSLETTQTLLGSNETPSEQFIPGVAGQSGIVPLESPLLAPNVIDITTVRAARNARRVPQPPQTPSA